MRFVICSTGTLGDFVPFLEIGVRLRQRQHHVVVAAPEPFRELAQEQGLEFEPTVSREAHQAVLARPELWNPAQAFGTMVEGFFVPPIRPLTEWVRRQPRPEEMLLIADFCSGPAARLAQEVCAVGLVSIWANPAALCSRISPPVVVGGTMSTLMYEWGSRLVLGPPVNAARAELGLAQVESILPWAVSKRASLALFPEWFAERASDWPVALDYAGFVLAPGRGDLSSEVEAFLQAGDPPVVVTFGTGMQHAQTEFELAWASCRRLGLRMLAVSPNRAAVSLEAHQNLCVVGFVSFDRLLPRSRMLIHHGGMGTCVRALASGIPQLVIPLCHDQPDNAARLVRLGVARQIARASLTLEALVAHIKPLLEAGVGADCRRWAEATRADGNGADRACAALERIAGGA
ncbi:MAG: glycosyltransferase family 1 protein [Candidatus Eremiobacteraeota bacterium]|nr:glycosyltransferase family 1 protein [Candidatus Eremiobacteraeota bacterium]